MATKDTKSNLYGECDVPFKSHTKLNTHFQISSPSCSEKEDFIATIVFVDKFKQKITLKNVEFKSDNQQGVLKILKQESVYNLNNIKNRLHLFFKMKLLGINILVEGMEN